MNSPWSLHPDSTNTRANSFGCHRTMESTSGQVLAATAYCSRIRAAARHMDFGVADYPDLMAGFDEIIRRGLADPDQLYVQGRSYGGYMTCWIIGHTDRFRAASAGASATHLLSDYGVVDVVWTNEQEYGGQPWRNADHLLAHSLAGYIRANSRMVRVLAQSLMTLLFAVSGVTENRIITDGEISDLRVFEE